jgi:molybdenum cofactor cytidylyltransferase
VVLLADMPLVTARHIDRLIEAFTAAPSAGAVVPVLDGERGNPVVLARTLFAAIARLSGDEGARRLLRDGVQVVEVAIDDAAIAADVDTPEALIAIRDAVSQC